MQTKLGANFVPIAVNCVVSHKGVSATLLEEHIVIAVELVFVGDEDEYV